MSEIFSEGPIQPIGALDDFLNRLKINNLSLSVEKDMLEIIQEFIEWVSYIERQSHIRIINPNKEPHFPDSGKIDTVIILNNINKLIGRSFNILKNSLSQPIFYNSPFFREEDFLGYATMFFFALLILREIKIIQNKLKKKTSDQLIWSNTFKIGIYCAIGFSLAGQSFTRLNFIKSLVSSEGVRQVRKKWTPLKELGNDAVKKADDEWKKEKAKGEMVWHDEMAQYVLREIKKSKPDLIKNYIKSIKKVVEKSQKREITDAEWEKYVLRAVRRAIKPMAKKYGRLWDASGKRGIE